MENRYEKGDLVKLKPNTKNNRFPISKSVGIVVDVLTRSSQNPDWDKLLVYIDGFDIFECSPRRLKSIEKIKKHPE